MLKKNLYFKSKHLFEHKIFIYELAIFETKIMRKKTFFMWTINSAMMWKGTSQFPFLFLASFPF